MPLLRSVMQCGRLDVVVCLDSHRSFTFCLCFQRLQGRKENQQGSVCDVRARQVQMAMAEENKSNTESSVVEHNFSPPKSPKVTGGAELLLPGKEG